MVKSSELEPFLIIPRQGFDDGDVSQVRIIVSAHARRRGAGADHVARLELITSELMSNVIFHGGRRGEVTLWADRSEIYLQVTDEGPGLSDPNAGRRRPDPASVRGGFGLFVTRSLADKLQIRTGPDGTTVTAYLSSSLQG